MDGQDGLDKRRERRIALQNLSSGAMRTEFEPPEPTHINRINYFSS